MRTEVCGSGMGTWTASSPQCCGLYLVGSISCMLWIPDVQPIFPSNVSFWTIHVKFLYINWAFNKELCIQAQMRFNPQPIGNG